MENLKMVNYGTTDRVRTLFDWRLSATNILTGVSRTIRDV